MHGVAHQETAADVSPFADQIADPSKIRKRSVVIAGHRTSVSLENIFWDQLRRIAGEKKISVNQLVSEIDSARKGNLSSAIRTHVLTSLI